MLTSRDSAAEPRPVEYVNRDYALSHTSRPNETTHETRLCPHPCGVTCFVHVSTSIQVNLYHSHTWMITRLNEWELQYTIVGVGSPRSSVCRSYGAIRNFQALSSERYGELSSKGHR